MIRPHLSSAGIGAGYALLLATATVGNVPGTAHALEGAHNEVPEICQATVGAAYATNEALALVAPFPFDVPPSFAAYSANLGLRLCPPQIVAPPNLSGSNGFQPDASTASANDPELPNPSTDDPNCYASILQTRTRADYKNFLGGSIFNGDWGTLGTPSVYHFNTDADVRMYGRPPADDPTTAGDESLRDYRELVADAQGRSILKLPVGRNAIVYRADTLVSPIDFAFIYIPNVPSGSKPFKELVKSSGVFRAVVTSTMRALQPGIEFLATEGALYGVDEAVGINWRHSQLGVFDDVVNQDFQSVWVYDVIPPSLTTRTDTSTLPATIRAVLEYDSARDVFYLEAIHPGGIRSGTATEFLGRLIDTDDHCNHRVTLRNDKGGLGFWPTGESIDLVWTASDPGPKDASGAANVVTLTHRVEVRDSFPPVLLAPPSQVHEVPAGQQSVDVNLGVARVFDLADLSPDVENDAQSAQFGLGLSEVTWTASDGFNSSTAVQLINIKQEGTNTPPVADAQTVDTQSFEETEIILTGSDADFHPSVDRFDPLTFDIVTPPSEGDFVAPLLPFFIDDFRLEASANRFAGNLMQENPSLYCDTRADSEPNQFQIAYPYQPEWIAVDDEGNSMVYDQGSARCDANDDLNVTHRLVVFDSNQDISAWTEVTAGGSPSDIFWDDNTNRIYVSRIDNQDDDWVYVYAPDLTQLARYNLGTGFSAAWQLDRPRAVTVDSRGIMYVANNGRVNAYRQIDGVFTVEGSDVFLGNVWDENVGTVEIQSLATDSDDNLYISYPDRIFKVTRSELSQLGVLTPGTLEGWLGYCSSNITAEYACDTNNRRSLGFACTDDLCGRDQIYGDQPGQFREARGISMNPDDVLYVSDFGNARVQRFTSDGSFGGEARSQGVGYGFLLGDFGNPQDIEVNSDHFYILNRDARLLHIFETTPLTPIDDGSASVIYRSKNNFVGTDQFRFSVTDGFDAAEANVTINVSRNFRPPEVPDIGLDYLAPTVLEDMPATFSLPATDPDGSFDTLSIVIVTPPEHGTVTVNGLDATYTPDANYFGSDFFTYRVFDGNEESAEEGMVSIDVSPIEDAPSIEVPADESVNLGFRLAHRVEVFDPDADETLFVTIDWGDGTSTAEGHFELDGDPIPPVDALNPDGTIKSDVTTTGPILAFDPFGRGALMADHAYTIPGIYQITSCVYDRAQVDPATQQKSPTGQSQQTCGSTDVMVGSAAELTIDVESPSDPQPAGADVDFEVLLSNQPFDADSSDPRFSQLPATGADIIGLTVTGSVAMHLELSDVSSPEGLCDVNGADFTCAFAMLPYDSDATMTIATRIAPDAPGRSDLGVALEGEWLDMRTRPYGGGTVEVQASGNGPGLVELSPAEGEPSGFTEVTVTGTDFETGIEVLFAGRPGTEIVVVDSTTLTVRTPKSPAGTVDVKVVNPDGQESLLAGAWTYQAAVAPPPPPPPTGGGGGGNSGGGSGGGGALNPLAVLLLWITVGIGRSRRWVSA